MTNATDVTFSSLSPGLWPQGSAPSNVGAALDALATAKQSAPTTNGRNPVSPPANSNYNAQPNDWVRWPSDVLGETIINLPNATVGTPRVRISKGGIGGVTVVTQNNQLIFCVGAGGVASFNVNDNSSFTVESDGTHWWVVDSQIP
jgi:hypothetical protein